MTVRYTSLILNEIPKAPIYDLEANIVNEITLPAVFGLPIRIDLIRRAVHSALTARIQPKGRDPLAGKRRCGESWGIGHGLARVPRLDNGRAVLAPNVVGGRRQFAPSPLRKIHEEINRKEMRLALMSAIAALANKYFVSKRCRISLDKLKSIPLIIIDDFENLTRTREVKNVLMKLGVWEEVLFAKERTRIRAGKGKMRGRRYITPKSLLIIVSSTKSAVINAIRNLPGIDYATPQTLNILTLAPGGQPGRLALITVKALNSISEMYKVEKP